MRIAFVSYEYPPETGGGGIGTYLHTSATVFLEHGHSVVVFTATSNADAFWENDFVYRIPAHNWIEFDNKLLPYFRRQHDEQPFDVLEATDFQGAGLSVKEAYPLLPMVVRLHTPLFLIDKLLFRPLSFASRIRYITGSLRRFRRPELLQGLDPSSYNREFEIVRLAERISTPSQSIALQLAELGFATISNTDLVPLLFDDKPFRQIFARENIISGAHVIFIGRLELRKGVIDLAEAIPLVLARFPSTRFTFIGKAAESPDNRLDMHHYLVKKLQKHFKSVHFTGAIPRTELLEYMAEGDVFVFPSHYESFGLACCEAMAAGKAVIGSKSGGMAEIIQDGESGILVEPKRPAQIADAIISIIGNDKKRLDMGAAARRRIQNYLSPSVVLPQQLNCYKKATAAICK